MTALQRPVRAECESLAICASCDFDVVALRDLAAFDDFGINAAIAVAEVACECLRNFEVANAGVGIDIGRRAARDALDDFQPRAAADSKLFADEIKFAPSRPVRDI